MHVLESAWIYFKPYYSLQSANVLFRQHCVAYAHWFTLVTRIHAVLPPRCQLRASTRCFKCFPREVPRVVRWAPWRSSAKNYYNGTSTFVLGHTKPVPTLNPIIWGYWTWKVLEHEVNLCVTPVYSRCCFSFWL